MMQRTAVRSGFRVAIMLISGLFLFLAAQEVPEYHYVKFGSVRQLQDYLAYSPDKSPLIGAHRGGPLPGFPENCIATFQNTLTYAPCLLECDVSLTKDGYLVMMHDDTLGRTTNGSGKVSAHTLAQLKSLKLKDNAGNVTEYPIPTFDEVLDWAVGKAILEIDIKREVDPESIVKAVIAHNALAYSVVVTYTNDQVKTYAALHPGLMISASAHTVDGVKRILDTGVEPARLIVFTGVTEPDPSVYKYLHEKGIRAILGTMHNIDNRALKRGIRVYETLLKKGVDILATDNVPLANDAIREFVKAQ